MVASAQTSGCPAGVDPKATQSLTEVSRTSDCATKMSHGYPIPDSACTPGAINPTVTLTVLQDGKFKTGCERDRASSRSAKARTYALYHLTAPVHNTGKTQSCELDHLVSLEIGGADTLDNIWPQCGPKRVALARRYFKIKDSVENYLAVQVRTGAMPLADVQHAIATDWTQFIAAAQAYWLHHSETGFGSDQ